MAKKKIDLKKVKEFLAAKGERVALGVALVIGVLLLSLGVLSGLKASKQNWVKPIDEKISEVKRKVLIPNPGPNQGPINLQYVWPDKERPVAFQASQLIPMQENTKGLRRLPQVFSVARTDVDPAKVFRIAFPWGISVLDANRQIQVDYLAAGVQSYEVNFDESKALALQIGEGEGEGEGKKVKVRLAEVLKPRKLIVVHAVYNFDRQLAEFAEALGFASVKDLVDKRDGNHQLPQVVGLDVTRLEWKPGDAEPTQTKIYQFLPDQYDSPKAKAKVKETETNKTPLTYLDNFFRATVFETQQTRHLGDLLERGLATPLPVLLTAKYPDLKVAAKGIKLPKPLVVKGDEKKPVNPFGDVVPKGLVDILKPKGQPNLERIKALTVQLAWDALKQETKEVEKFKGGYYVLDPEGTLTPKEDHQFQDKKFPFQKPPPEDPQADPKDKEEPSYNKLIRFIDVLPAEARPGHTYAYSLRVWLANPFHGRPKEADTLEWTKKKALEPGGLTFTPAVTLPPEFFYYAVDQDPLVSKAPKGSDVKGAIDPERVAVQIHRWIDLSNAGGAAVLDPYQIADWVVAERLLVRRGELIGRRGEFNERLKDDPSLVHVEIPYWDYQEGRFILKGEHLEKDDKKKKKGSVFKATGIPMIFSQIHQRPPVLVDFEGGAKTSRAKIDDMLADYEMLILDQDNRLFVRRSGADSADPERQQRYKHWRDRLLYHRELMKGPK